MNQANYYDSSCMVHTLKEKMKSFWPKKLSRMEELQFDPGSDVIG